jgi:hypothetical protein
MRAQILDFFIDVSEYFASIKIKKDLDVVKDKKHGNEKQDNHPEG